MAKILRGPTRTLPVRLAEAEAKAELLKKRMEQEQTRRDIQILRRKLFGR